MPSHVDNKNTQVKNKNNKKFLTYSDRERKGHLEDLYTIPHILMLQRQFQNQNDSLHYLTPEQSATLIS